MKRISFLLCLVALNFLASAQDVIVTKDARKIEAKVLEASDSEVKYKKYSNLNGPTYVEKKANISSIIYANGEVETFQASSATVASQPSAAATPVQPQTPKPAQSQYQAQPQPQSNRAYGGPIPTSPDEEGVKIHTSGFNVYDNVFLENRAGANLRIVLKGQHTKLGEVEIGRAFLYEGAELHLNTVFEDKLKMFAYMTVIGQDDVQILQCTAYESHQDVHIIIEKTSSKRAKTVGSSAQATDATEQLKQYKEWLDLGIITQDEFNAKRRELIGF